MSSVNLLAEYNASRAPGTDRSVLCHAPFISLNFDQSGRASACCFNRHFVLGTYPQQSVRDMWTGAPAQALREAFRTGAHAPGCERCFGQLEHRNFSGALMQNFDSYTARGAARPPTATACRSCSSSKSRTPATWSASCAPGTGRRPSGHGGKSYLPSRIPTIGGSWIRSRRSYRRS